jgi:hypothetical protein
MSLFRAGLCVTMESATVLPSRKGPLGFLGQDKLSTNLWGKQNRVTTLSFCKERRPTMRKMGGLPNKFRLLVRPASSDSHHSPERASVWHLLPQSY